MLIGNYVPRLSELLGAWVIPGTLVPIPIGICLFLMVYPILVRTQFERLKEAARAPKPLVMFALAWFFLKSLWGLPEYAMGMIVLECAPCTAMVLFWSMLSKSSVEFCVVVSAVHTLIMLVAYAPLASFLAGLIIPVPWEAIALAVGLFLGLPLVLGVATRYAFLRYKGIE